MSKIDLSNVNELKPIIYIDYKVRNVTKIKNKYGFRIVLILTDNSTKEIQHSGFEKKNEAEKERCKIIAQLENKTYIAYSNITVKEYMEYWYKYIAPKRLKSYNSFLSYRNGIFNHIIPNIGKVQLIRLGKGIIKNLYQKVYVYSKGVAQIVQTIMVSALEDAKVNKFVASNEAIGIKLPKTEEEKIKEATTIKEDYKFHILKIDETKTFSIEQIALLIKKSKNTPIYLHILFASLMGLRKSEINGIKYSDIDFIHRKLKLNIQLGRRAGDTKEDCLPKCLTTQEIPLKTKSSERELDIPDIVYEAILEERKKYEKNKRRRINDKTNPFRDLNYVCCSSYGKPRSKGFVYNYFLKLKKENNLPDLAWHKLRTTYTTILAKNDFSLKAISILLGHSSEIITFENYTDKNEIICECLEELEPFIESVIPKQDKENITDCTELETDIIMQEAFHDIKTA